MPTPASRANPRAAREAHPPATPAAYAQAMVQAMHDRGLDPAAALAQAQITPAQMDGGQGWISAAQLELLSAAAMQRLDDEALGAFERRLPWGSYGMLVRASITSANLELALRRWCRHHGLLTGTLRLRLVKTGDTAGIEIEESAAHRALPGLRREFSLVYLLRNVHGVACWLVDSRIALRQSSFPYDAPGHAQAYAHMFGDAVSFGQAAACIRFDSGYLALPLRRDEAALRQMLQRALPLTVWPYRRDRLLVAQVRQALRTASQPPRRASELAALLNQSARTLHRQLRSEGATLQQIRDEVRRERAQELLLRTARPLKQIAAAVGFQSEKSFIRAFRAWTDQTPAQWRGARTRPDARDGRSS